MPKKRSQDQVEAEPLTKRQRKVPSWLAQTYVTGNSAEGKPTDDELGAAGTAAAGVEASPSHDEDAHQIGSPLGEVVEHRQVNPDQIEVVVAHGGKRYKGLMDRTALPPGIGIPAQVTNDELQAIKGATQHGQNPNNLCGLCNLPLEKPPVTGISDDKANVYLKVRISANWVARVHLQCAVWSPEVQEDELYPNHYHNMGACVRRGRALRCRHCKERGATLGCFRPGCQHVFHLPCAVEHGCATFERGRKSTYEMWCPTHRPAEPS